MNQNVEEIGKIIRQKRIEKGLSQREVARRLYVSPATVSKWENGRHLPDPTKFVDISEVLGCTIDELMGKVCASPGEYAETVPQAIENTDTSLTAMETDTASPTAIEADISPPTAIGADILPPTALDADIDTSVTPDPPQASPAEPAPPLRTRPRIHKKPAILLAVFLLAAVSCIIAVSHYTNKPRYKVVDSFHGDESAIEQKRENAYYVIVEYQNFDTQDDFDTYGLQLKKEYQKFCNKDVTQLIILFYNHYDPGHDYEDTADCRIIYYPQNENIS